MTPQQIAAARERCERAQHLSLRTTQCCDVSIDGAIGAALEFISRVRTDLTLALDALAAKDAEIAELRDAQEIQEQAFVALGQSLGHKQVRIAELERENERLNARITQAENQTQLFYGREFDAVMESQRLSAALKVARQGSPLSRFAELYCGHDPLSGKPAELAVMERIAELERENERSQSALKVAREAIESQEHNDDCRYIRHFPASFIKHRLVDTNCNCWIREALAAIDAALSATPLASQDTP